MANDDREQHAIPTVHAAHDAQATLKALNQLLTPQGFFTFAIAMIVFLVFMSSLAVLINTPANLKAPVSAEQPWVLLAHLFYLSRETNIPTFFNSALHGTAAVLLLTVGRVAFQLGRAHRFHWVVLGVIFVIFAYDEAARLHEGLTSPIRRNLGALGLLYYAWVIPGMAFVGVIAIAYIGFLRALPRRIALLMVLGGAIFVGGAIGMEMIGGYFDRFGMKVSWRFVLVATIEETMEMLGITVFCTAILTLIQDGARGKHAYFAGKSDADPAP